MHIFQRRDHATERDPLYAVYDAAGDGGIWLATTYVHKMRQWNTVKQLSPDGVDPQVFEGHTGSYLLLFKTSAGADSEQLALSYFTDFDSFQSNQPNATLLIDKRDHEELWPAETPKPLSLATPL